LGTLLPHIISQSGSGLANAIFCRKASLGIFISEYLIKNEYWAKLLKFNECKLTYIQVDGDETLHSDIYVPLPSINKYLVDCK
jgi:capsular polysaccharide biosynthesis protein